MVIRLYAVDTENKNMTWITGLLIPATQEQIDEAADVAKERERLVERLNNLHANYDELRTQLAAANERAIALRRLLREGRDDYWYENNKAEVDAALDGREAIG